MPPVDRNNPKRAKSSDARLSLLEFTREFPDDATCLEWLWRSRHSDDGENAHCAKCDKTRAFKRYETKQRRQAWTCTACGHHVHPTAGTIFHKSSTSLHLWFYALYLMASTRCGISAKQLEREIGVNYKTALRMFHAIRDELMAQDDDEPLSGAVEADETQIRGKIRQAQRRERDALGIHKRAWAYQHAAKVFAAVERGGRVRASVIPDSSAATLGEKVRENIAPGSILYTDEWRGYEALAGEYDRRTIRHRDRIYASGATHTQTAESFFALLKNAIRGVHHGVSERWLQGYVNEYAWRWNNREDDDNPGYVMFRALLESAARS